MCGSGENSFDIAAAAGWYSAIAGLLAGFALLAVLLPLDHEAVEDNANDREASNAVIVFTCAFFSLLILSFTYAVLSGRPPGLAAAYEQQLNGVALGLASLLLLLGLREVLGLYGGNRLIFLPARNLIARFIAIYGPVVVLAFQFANSVDVTSITGAAAQDCPPGASAATWLDAGMLAASAVFVLLLPVTTRRLHIASTWAGVLGRVTLGATVAVAVWTSTVVPFIGDDVIGGQWFHHATVAAAALGTAFFAAVAWLSR